MYYFFKLSDNPSAEELLLREEGSAQSGVVLARKANLVGASGFLE
jgi:hypothetical protein